MLADYRAALGIDATVPFAQAKDEAEAALAKTRADAEAALAALKNKRGNREAKAAWARREAEAKARLESATQALWLTEKFGEHEGTYRDIPGLCKAATRAEIAAKNYSFTPGVYVGVPETPPEDESVFAERMAAIHAELAMLSTQAEGLMKVILANAETLTKKV